MEERKRSKTKSLKKPESMYKRELTLAETNQFLSAILDHTPILIAYMDSQFNFIRVNRAYAEADEREVSFFPGKNHFVLYPNEENETIFRRVVETGEPYFAEAKPFEYAEHPERGVSYWDWSLIPIKGPEGVVEGLVLTLQDVTEEKIAKEKLKKSEEQYRNAYNLVNFYKDLFAHDMNNILQSIILSADFYSRYRNNAEMLKELGDIAQVVSHHAERGAKLISNVIKLTRLDEAEAELRPIEIFEVLNRSVENTVSGFKERNVNIEIEGLSEDTKIYGNELLIDIFDNILNNAVKYNDNDNEVKVDIKISKIREDNTQYLKFEFKDYGIGIPKERKKTLFNGLHTEDISKRGMGIGLSLVKKIVDKYGGKIWVEDRIKGDYKKGSNFIILLKEAQ
ncbi:MAG: sensor histidine kinase [Candidatus Jordarchaeum sp.]|uniref:sensor histidine kinase n=1 Tax=Candidatus Jordarchaeum sp. TaxID=2823881 RepID=UPI004049CE46